MLLTGLMPMSAPSSTTETRPPSAVLSPVRAVFRAVTLTIVPDAAKLDEQGWTQVEELVAETLQTRPQRQQRQLRLLLYAIQWLPVLCYGRRFSSLDRSQRERFLSSLQDHRLQLIRTGFWGLRTLVLLGYYGRPEVARSLGYVPDSRGWGAIR
jgi:hypothetical protein